MRYIYVLIILCCLSCNNDRVVQLPEIKNAEITKVLDVSPAYIFYDETQPDSTLLNRKNLIGTTNWLVNVDKRLSLRQVIPHITFLQDKKRNAEIHKNEDAKNYFTCNTTSINNLGFIEFTPIYYKNENPDFIEFSKKNIEELTLIKCHADGRVLAINLNRDFKTILFEQDRIPSSKAFNRLLSSLKPTKLVLFFQDDVKFQDYITIKSYFSALELKELQVFNIEYLF